MAADAGFDLRPYAGRGSGPEGRIVKVDVERLLADGGAPAPSAPAVPGAAPAMIDNEAVRKRYPDSEPTTPSPMLRTVARRMAEAKATVPHFYVESEIDMQRAMALRSELNAALADSGERVSVNDLVLRASALALIDNPQFNRSWIDGTLLVHKHVNLGIAVALDDGLIVPVIREADDKSLRQIAREARDLAVRARDG
jgi:pyruvate dehydrogenase E2 component (dihydrolipoamide acetyltransferase)